MQAAFATKEKIYTVEEYLEMEEKSRDKHDFYNGKISIMPGASLAHNVIAGNVITAINIALKQQKKKCLVCPSDLKIHIPRLKSFVYPDAVVICEQPRYYEGRNDVLLNPLLVVEIESYSTSKYDRTTKFWDYQSLPSFKEYVIIKQDMPWVKAFYKTGEHTWADIEADHLEQSILLKSVDCTIRLEDIYSYVEF